MRIREGWIKVFSGGLTKTKEWRVVGLLKGYTKGKLWKFVHWVDCERGGLILRMSARKNQSRMRCNQGEWCMTIMNDEGLVRGGGESNENPYLYEAPRVGGFLWLIIQL